MLGAGVNRGLPTASGLYRVRRSDSTEIVYIGQTGKGLRDRLRMLSGTYATEMPYNDPHTAAPALWALRRSENVEFDVSVVQLSGNKQSIVGEECVAITMHRRKSGSSPAFNFGGMPPGYRKSSSNNRRLVDQRKRFRGGADADAPVTPASIAPLLDPTGDVVGTSWCSLLWSDWCAADDRNAPVKVNGLYRLRRRGSSDLLYIGQGVIARRVLSHCGKADFRVVAPGRTLEVSWVATPKLVTRQRLEWENDLIASHVLSRGATPRLQFGGTG